MKNWRKWVKILWCKFLHYNKHELMTNYGHWTWYKCRKCNQLWFRYSRWYEDYGENIYYFHNSKKYPRPYPNSFKDKTLSIDADAGANASYYTKDAAE